VDDRFYHAFLPPVAEICGRRLERFSLWHHVVLSAIQSPLVGHSDKITAADLLVAVRVCRLKYGETKLAPGIRDIIWRIKFQHNRDLFVSELEKFFKWTKLQTSPPKYYINKRSTSISGIDRGSRCLALVCSMMHRAGMSMAEAWELTLGQAAWMDAQLAQVTGVDLRFLDDEDVNDDSPIDISTLTDDEALAMFRRDLPAELVDASFKHWKENVKGKPL
jgi:hypothetical protein